MNDNIIMIRAISIRMFLVIAFAILSVATPSFGYDGVPAWLSQAASSGVPVYDNDVPLVVLHTEKVSTLGNDGKLVTRTNYAIKVLTRDGRRFAVAREFYLASFGKVRDMNAWVVRPDGTIKEYEKKSIIDIISDDEDVYNEGRVKVINATDDVEVGSVFGYTSETEETPLFNQDRWEFQSRFPTIRSRFALNLPVGWTASSITFNTAEVKPQVSGSNYSWEMRSLAPITPEPMSPSVYNLSPRIVVNYGSDTKSSANQSFGSWTDVSRWGTMLHDPFVIVDDSVAAKARDLTATSKTEFEKIQAIGTFVQNLQYISIDIGVGHGNGYRPRSSSTVLARGYGDCKDKANLMRAMLRALKIEAYPVFIFSGDPTFVREQWPSPRQFNHCIIAVRVSDETKSPTIMVHEKLGRLLIFDATDAFTPVGDLPDYLQGSYALIAAGENGGIAKMPLTPPETDMVDRVVEAKLDAQGILTGKITEKSLGQSSTDERRASRGLSVDQYKKMIEAWLTRGATGAQLFDVNYKDIPNEARFDLTVDFKAPMYAQLMQGRLLVFKPVVVSRRNGVSLTEPKRSSPIEIDSSVVRETATFDLPAGFGVDEMPDPVTLETDFGKYTTTYEVVGQKLIFKRSLRLTRSIISPEKYESVRSFYAKMREAEQSPVVLIKK